MPNELRQSFALLPCCSKPWIWIAKPGKSGIKKFIGRRSAAAGALSVERPAKNELRRTIVFSSHSSEPMVDQRRFSDSAPGNNCNKIDLLVCPCIVQETDVLFTTKNIASCDGQSGYGNLLRCRPCWRFAGSDTRSGRDGEEGISSWSESALEAANIAQEAWVRVKSNMPAQQYDVDQAVGEIPAPEWPEEPLSVLLRKAFGKRIIDNEKHPAILTLQGAL